jgi:dTDP-glucose pyrophosphorylase
VGQLMPSDYALVILAAGLGSRFGGLKQLKPLGPGGNVLLEYTAFDAIRAGFRNIVFIIQRPLAEDFTSLVSSLPNDVSIEFAFQDLVSPRTKPWGTAHALLTARDLVHGPFVMCNADDYYGASAFERAAEFFARQDTTSEHYGMLGYRLDATLSAHGSVSRAICDISDSGCLTSVTEHPNIKRKDGRIISFQEHGKAITLDAFDRASMNFWMLTHSIFPFLEIEVRRFIEQHKHDPSAEIRLPDIIQNLIQGKQITAECLPHDDAWFGLTHSSDYAAAVPTIQAMHDDGTYPTPLWKNDA